MDFALDETQRTIASVARETLAREPAGSAWKALSRAGLLGLAVPSRLGGEGLGLLETAVLLTEVGRAAAPLPALHTLALGVLPVVALGTERQQDALLPEVASGDRLLTAAVRASATVHGGTLSGVAVGVGWAATAHRILVPVVDDVFLVDPRSPEVSLIRTPTSGELPEFTAHFDRVPAEPLGSGGAALLHRLGTAAACLIGDGLLSGALDLTAVHVRSREQFGKPLATFQAVSQQIADVYISARTLHLASTTACWKLSTYMDAIPHLDADGDVDANGHVDVGGDVDADADLEVAAYWLADEGLAAVQICHHLHGGLGVDAAYPLHRYSSAMKDLVRFLGGAEHRLEVLGARVVT